MRAKAVETKQLRPVDNGSLSITHARRVDLVVTDWDGPEDGYGMDAGALHHEAQCTIPLAILTGAISSETLREAVRVCRPATREPISSDEFLHLLESAVNALRRANAPQAIDVASAADQARIERLTPREREVLNHVVAGYPNKRTAAALNISRRTVEHHRAAIMQKTRTKSVSELVRLALRTGLFAPEGAND